MYTNLINNSKNAQKYNLKFLPVASYAAYFIKSLCRVFSSTGIPISVIKGHCRACYAGKKFHGSICKSVLPT